MLRDVVVSEYEKRFPSAVKCFLDDSEASIAHLRFPIAHRRVIRTTNLLERLFGEERRRMKIVANVFEERAVLKPCPPLENPARIGLDPFRLRPATKPPQSLPEQCGLAYSRGSAGAPRYARRRGWNGGRGYVSLGLLYRTARRARGWYWALGSMRVSSALNRAASAGRTDRPK